MHHSTKVETLRGSVEEHTGESVAMCYQCGKCSAGCPLADEMDIAPNQVIRMLQLGFPELEDKVLKSHSIWLCLSCETCYSRCPKNVDLPAIMDTLRAESLSREKVNPKAMDILAFNKTFLGTIRNIGRLYEVGLTAGYKFRTWHLLQDVVLVPSMLMKGKLKLFPHNVKGKESIEKIFARTIDTEARK